MKIKAHCPFLGHTGYNAHTRGFFTALSEVIDLRVDNYTWCDDRHNYLTARQKRIISEITLTGPKGQESQHPPDWKEEIEDFQYDVDIVLHEHNHKHFWREYTKPKIAYTVWETDRYGADFFKRILQYDELWVPSEWQRECSVAQGYPEDRVKVVPEAVEPDCFPDKAIVPDDSIFTFCLLGRWDNRKSTTEILECFIELFGNNPKVQLIASIDNPFAEDGLSTQERFKKMGWGDIKNIILKSFPSRPEYVEIIRRSHVFLSCARSEGWNIPLIEAMACGVPSIYSDCSGQTEFASGKGIPIRILGKELVRIGDGAVASQFTSKMPGHYYVPDFTHLKKKMQMCVDQYDTLKKKALQESIEIRSTFTWENAARIALNHLENFRAQFPNVNVLVAADDAYLKYANICIESIKKHSDYNVILYGYDTHFEGKTTPPNTEIRRLRRWPLSKNGRNLGIMSSRISMCLDALKQHPNDLFIMVDADMVAMKDLRPFFNEQFDRLENHPLCITYKHDNLIHFNIKPDGTKIEKGHGDEAASAFGIEPRLSTPNHPIDFTIAHGLFIFDGRSTSFLTELLELCLGALDKDSPDLIDDMAMVDERIHNALLWKYGFTNHLPLSWVSKDEDNDFLQADLKKYIDAGFDVVYTHQDRHSYDITADQLLFLHGKSSLQPPSSQLMIVAHPDDETIFGFSELDGDTDWKIVCVSSDNREDDFYKSMEFYGIKDYEIWDFHSSIKEAFPSDSLDKRIERLIKSKQWNKVVTHNPCGEYGHIQHKNVFDSVKKHCDNFYVFCKSPLKLAADELQRKQEVLQNYSSEDIIHQLRELNGDWYIMPDMSTNYIEHGTVEPYNSLRDTTPFIHCWEKMPDYSPPVFSAKEVFLVTSFCDNAEKIQLLKETLQYLKPLNIPMCVHDAAGVGEDLIKAGADFLIVDPSNPIPDLTERSLYASWSLPCNEHIVLNSHSPDCGGAAVHQLQSGLLYLSSLGYDVAHIINYDVFIDYNFFSNTASPKALKHDAVLYYWGIPRDFGCNTSFYSINLHHCNKIIRSMSFADYIATVPPDGHFEDYIELKILGSIDLAVDKVPFQDFKDLIYDKMSFYTGSKDNKDGTFDCTQVFTAPLTPKTQLWLGRKKTPELPDGGPASVIFYDIKEDFEAKLIVNGEVFETKVEKSQVTDYFLLESTINGDNIESAEVIIDGDTVISEDHSNILLNSIEFKTNPMIETLSKKLTDQDIVFWQSHLDRDFIANTLFPTIGEHFRPFNNEVRLLDIGIQSYNRADKDLLNNNEIKFYGLDISKNCDIPDDWTGMIYTDLSQPHCFAQEKFRRYFDVIIDYGVLGWPDVNEKLASVDFTNYINNILYALKDTGLYFFKNDLMGHYDVNPGGIQCDKAEKVRNFVCRHFEIKPFHNISNVTVGAYETFVFQKKLRENLLDLGHLEGTEFGVHVYEEVFTNQAYEKLFPVEKGDIVVDVGASFGPFTCSILHKEPSKVFCIEPSVDLLPLLTKNVEQDFVSIINKGISDIDGKLLSGAYADDPENPTMFDTITFQTFVSSNRITTIDFLKTDCEGAEYDIFNSANLEWIKSNVKKIGGEWHLNSDEKKAKFRWFRDHFLSLFSNYKVFSIDGVDITEQVHSEDVVAYYTEVMVYIDNRSSFK